MHPISGHFAEEMDCGFYMGQITMQKMMWYMSKSVSPNASLIFHQDEFVYFRQTERMENDKQTQRGKQSVYGA